jgi:hypothetical protein
LYVTHGGAKSHAVTYLTWIPLYGFFDRIIHPAVYSVVPWKASVETALDYVALLGVALTLIAVARLALGARWNASSPAIYLLSIAVAFLGSRDVWIDAYNFGRVLSPLLLLTFLEQRFSLAALAPMALIDLRISLGFAGQLEGIVRGLLK